MMQRQQRFVADQRFDLPQYDSMIALISAEFQAYNKSLFSPKSRVVQNWKIANAGGLAVTVDQSMDSTLFDCQNVGREGFLIYPTTSPQLVLGLIDNSTNYVEVQIVATTTAPDTVAIWDTTANGGTGQEFTQNVNTVAEQLPTLVSNVVAFSGATDRLPLAIVTTAGGAITSIQDSRKFLFNVEVDWTFPSVRSDKTIGSLKNAYDAQATIMKEIKGTNGWTDIGWSSVKTLKEYQNAFFYGGGVLAWDGTTLNMPGDLGLEIAGRPNPYAVLSGSYAIPEGSALYVDIPPGTPSGAITPIIAPLASVPINPTSTGFSPYLQVVFFRRNGILYSDCDIPDLDPGESAVIGESIAQSLQGRLGVINDANFEAYSSTNYVPASASYPEAISDLDQALQTAYNEINQALTSHALEDSFVISAPQTDFTSSDFSWSPDNTIPDIQVYRNGQKMTLAKDGTALTGDYQKTSQTNISFFYPINANTDVNAKITIRQERTGGGAVLDLTNINVNPQPLTPGGLSIGTAAKSWSAFYLHDTVTSHVYKLAVTNGIIDITQVS
jgi:hypothetical protein